MPPPDDAPPRPDVAASRIAALAGVMVCAALARKLPMGALDAPVWDALRLRDALPMFLLAPAAVLLAWRLFREYGGPASPAATGLFLASAYLLGLGYGMHEPFNVLSGRYGGSAPPALARSMAFFDDGLGHYAFFAAFAGVTLAVAWAESRRAAPAAAPAWLPWTAGMAGLAVAAALAYSMRGERAAVDVGVAAATCGGCLLAHATGTKGGLARKPIAFAVLVGYGGGAAAAAAAWLL